MSKNLPVVYTDGACTNNGGQNAKAGWGVYWGPGHADNNCGPVSSGAATNNRGELEAVSRALDQALDRNIPELVVRTDSKLLVDSVDNYMPKWKENGWKTSNGGDVKNSDLLREIDYKRSMIDVHFDHVPSHSGIRGNEAADGLAKKGASMYGRKGSYY